MRTILGSTATGVLLKNIIVARKITNFTLYRVIQLQRFFKETTCSAKVFIVFPLHINFLSLGQTAWARASSLINRINLSHV